eukprot:g3538.t1
MKRSASSPSPPHKAQKLQLAEKPVAKEVHLVQEAFKIGGYELEVGGLSLKHAPAPARAETLEVGTQTLGVPVRLGAVLATGTSEHRYIDFSNGAKVVYDTKKIWSNVEDFRKKALGPDLLKHVEAFRDSLVRGSVKDSTEKAYMSSISAALQLAGLPWSALPVRDARDYSVLMASIFGVASRSTAHTVKDEKGVLRVKWSFISTLKAAMKFFHETRVVNCDFTSIASASEVLRMFTAIKKASRREVQKPKEAITFLHFVELSDFLRGRCNVWTLQGQDWVCVGLKALLKNENYVTSNSVRQLAALMRDMLMLRIGVLAERRKSELVALLEDSVEVSSDGGLALQVLRGKTEFSRGDLACGRKAVVPAVALLQPSPKVLLSTLKTLKQHIKEAWKWTCPPPKVGPDPKKEFGAPHWQVADASGDALSLQEQRHALPSFDNKKKQFALWNTGSLSKSLQDRLNTSELSFKVAEPGRLSLRATGALFFSRTDRRAAIQNAGWTSAQMSFQVYAKLSPEQLADATKRCILIEAKAAGVMKGLGAAVAAEKKPRSIGLALLKVDPVCRICEFLTAVVDGWHLLDYKHRKIATSINWDSVIGAANEGTTKLLLSTDRAKEAAKKLRRAVAVLVADATKPLEPEEVERLSRLFNLRRPELDVIAEREADSYFEAQRRKLYTQRTTGVYAEALLRETVDVEAVGADGSTTTKKVQMPHSKDEAFTFLQAQDGPMDSLREKEDRATAAAMSMDPEASFLAEIPVETRQQWFGGFRLQLVEQEDRDTVFASWREDKPAFSMDDFPSIQLDVEASRKELLRILEIGKAVRWPSRSSLPPGYSVAPANLIVRDHRNRYVNDWTVAGRLFGINLPAEGGVEAQAQLLFAAMGLSVSPGINDYSIKARIAAFQRFMPNLRVVDFVDDLRGTSAGSETSFREVYLGMMKFRIFIRRLGILLHDFRADKLDKCIFPTKNISWIGFAVDSVAMTVHVDPERLAKTICALGEFLRAARDKPCCNAKELASIIGKLNFLTFVAFLFTPELLDSPEMFEDIRGEDIAIITTDASRLGWGFSIDDDSKRGCGRWEFDGASKSSNYRELITVQKTLEQKDEDFGGRKFLFFRTDNTTARHYVNAGTGRCPDLAELAGNIIQLCLLRGLTIMAAHIQGKANVVADALSRLWLNSTLWDANPHKRLNPRILNAVQARIGFKITKDVMCSRGGANSLTGYDFYDFLSNCFSVKPEDGSKFLHEVLWFHPSLDLLQVTVKHLVSFLAVPLDSRIIALVLVPKVNSRLAFLFAKLFKLTRLKKGGVIFQNSKGDGCFFDLPPTEHPHLILSTMSREDLLLQLQRRSELKAAAMQAEPQAAVSMRVEA